MLCSSFLLHSVTVIITVHRLGCEFNLHFSRMFKLKVAIVSAVTAFCVFTLATATMVTPGSPKARKPQRQHPFASFNVHSCEERCDTIGHNHEDFPCQCNSKCIDFDDCCADYEDACLSCELKCGTYNKGFPCQCNRNCLQYGNCCDDYDDKCRKRGLITNAELARLSEEFLSLDENNVGNLVTVRIQGINRAGGPDLAPSSLLELQPGARAVATISKLLPLLDNYIPASGKTEVITDEELEEEKQFLDAIFATPIIGRLEEFLANKTVLFTGSFRRVFRDIWFGMYSRRRNVLGSSAFEHIFLGELKNGISGFHNWIYFANEEARGTLNYKGHIKTFNFGQKGQAISHTFDWLNNTKPISSMFIGSSPEFEMAIYTLCFYARPNSRCPIRLNSLPIQIQTYEMNYNGDKHIGSAYPILS